MNNEHLRAMAILLQNHENDSHRLYEKIKWLQSKVKEYYGMLSYEQKKEIAKKTGCECECYGLSGQFYACDDVYLPCPCVGGV